MECRLSFARLSDADLTGEMKRLLGTERGAAARLIACMAEFDARRLHLAEGFNSMFTYCRDHLHLGDGAAYRRIEAARASRRFPVILELIADGAITLTNLGLIAQHLTEANHTELLAEIRHKRKTDVELIVAGLKPKPDVRTLIRKMPAQKAIERGAESPVMVADSSAPEAFPAPAPARPVIAPLRPERFRLQITMNQETHDRLRQLQNLMRHSIPNGDAALIIERALVCLLQEVLRRKCGARKSDFKGQDTQPETGGHAELFH